MVVEQTLPLLPPLSSDPEYMERLKRLDELKMKSKILETELKESEAKRGRSISPMLIHNRAFEPMVI